MIKFPNNLCPVLVTWIDSVGSRGWQSKFEKANMTCYSVGHLMSKSKDRITICLNTHGSNVGEVMEIPLVAVKKIRKLK